MIRKRACPLVRDERRARGMYFSEMDLARRFQILFYRRIFDTDFKNK